MLRTILAALAFVGATVGAQASTLRIDVVGASTGGTVTGSVSYNTENYTVGGGWSRPVEYLPATAARHAEFLAATTGTATYVPGPRVGQFTGCAGLLVYLCAGQVTGLDVDLRANTFAVSGFDTTYSYFSANQSGGTFLFESLFLGFTEGSMIFASGMYGMTTLGARFTDVSLVAAPLPAGALLMLTGLGALAVARRATVRRT